MNPFDAFSLLVPFALLLLGFVAGKVAEARHYKSIREREKGFMRIPAITGKVLPEEREVKAATLVTGSVVVSVDYYKRLLMALRRIFGGEVRSYSSLIDRGRREAILRMKERRPDAELFLNCRVVTSTLYNGRGKSVGSVEIVASGTAVKFAS